MSADLVEEHLTIWRTHHGGIALSDSKADWLDLLAADPEMRDPINWGDLAGSTTADERERFKTWLLEGVETDDR